MHRLVSLLPQAAHHFVKNIWNELETQFGINGTHNIPYPHFTWAVGEEFPEEALKTAVQELAGTIEPFLVYASGLGIFPGESPVLYIPVVKTRQLYNIHQKIWHRLQPFGNNLCPLYQPENWVPHIYLAGDMINRDKLGSALQKLAFEDINLKMEIDNLAFIDAPEGKTGELKFSISLTPGTPSQS